MDYSKGTIASLLKTTATQMFIKLLEKVLVLIKIEIKSQLI
jgi:hypothetical protein